MAVKFVDTASNPLHCVNTSYELAEQRLFSDNSLIFPLKFKQSLNSVDNFSNVLLTASNENTVKCIDANTLVLVGELTGHTDIVMDVEFAKTSPFVVWSCGLDGTVRSWDLRTNLNEITFQSLEEDKLLSVSLSLDDQLVCGGGESLNQDEEEVKANMYIWDVKMKDYFQVYNEVFAESIDHVVFHPNNKPLLLAGCRDGLVYLFDVRENENNACLYVLNAEAGITQVDFFDHKHNNIYCLTDEGTIFLWESNEGNELCKFAKSKLGNDVIDCFYDERSEKLIAAVGNEKGDIEMVILNENGKKTPWFSLQNGHQAGVRALCWNFVSEKIITSCEDGMVALWIPKICPNGAI
eukprot:TRINITY_DN6039_c0_g4_i1.p1 TRINITY_DN6039_c0_g4~~TRINITY_DN6039_c0_g4_i1.p1  ORF type:complete len:367 (-),score=63.84 TRINITY_DN6039_c0_g4_i1:242-1297(-)